MTHLRQAMLDELQRRNYAPTTVQYYIQAVERFAKHFHRRPDQLNQAHLREYQAYLLRDRQLEPRTVKLHVSALRFFFVKTLKRRYLLDDIPYRTNGKRSLKVRERRVKKHLAPFFRGRLLANITPTDIRAYIAKRQADVIIVRKTRFVNHGDGQREEIPAVTKPVSAGEINRELTALKRMLSLAVQAEKLTRKPHIPMLMERNSRLGFFEPEQLDAAVANLPEEIRPVTQFAAITGWRIASEVLPLEWRQVDMAAGEVRLDAHTTKNGEGRIFPFTTNLRALLIAPRV